MSSRRPGSAIEPEDEHGEEPLVDRSSPVEQRRPAPDAMLTHRTPPSMMTPAGPAGERADRDGLEPGARNGNPGFRLARTSGDGDV